MLTNDVLIDGFKRVHGVVNAVLADLTTEQLHYRPTKDANSIAWLIWHLARVQDDHIAQVAGAEQQWFIEWYKTFKLPYEKEAIGYGQSSAEVGAMKTTAARLRGYYDDVFKMTERYLEGLKEQDYLKVIDASWDPPVTLAVRLVSILNDTTQHAGQAAYVKGLLAPQAAQE